jgi:hypothetical protein
MDFKALLKIGIVAGVLMNAFDIIVQGTLMASLYTAPVFRNPEEEIVYLVLTDFVAAFVFVWIYLKLGSAAGPGVVGGATFGFYAGVLYAFPMFYAMHLLFKGYTAELAWLNTVYQVIVYVIIGATAGALNKARPAASRWKAF